MHGMVGITRKAPGTLTAVKAWRIGSLPGAVVLQSPDIGRARLEDRREVYITWGHNLTAEEQLKWQALGWDTVWCGADQGESELIIPDRHAEKLLPILIA